MLYFLVCNGKKVAYINLGLQSISLKFESHYLYILRRPLLIELTLDANFHTEEVLEMI